MKIALEVASAQKMSTDESIASTIKTLEDFIEKVKAEKIKIMLATIAWIDDKNNILSCINAGSGNDVLFIKMAHVSADTLLKNVDEIMKNIKGGN